MKSKHAMQNDAELGFFVFVVETFLYQPNLHNASHAILRISIQTQVSVIRLFHPFEQFETFICVCFSVFLT